MAIYRTTAGGSQFFKFGSAPGGGSFTDTGNTPLTSQQIDDTSLNGNYSYMITYYKAGEPESRPSALVGPQNIVNGRIHLTNFPSIPTPPSTSGFPAYDSIRIYLNTASDQNSFYLVDTIPASQDYTDAKSDTAISNLAAPGNKTVDLDGPSIPSNTLSTNVIKRDGSNYQQAFTTGTLEFAARKGGRTLETKSFAITSTSTMQDLMNFMFSAMGIQSNNTDSQNPIPGSVNNIKDETGTIQPGAYIKNGQLRFVSNNGVDNAVAIDLTSFKVKDAEGNVTNPNLAFGSVQKAKGQSTVTDFIPYDTLGPPIRTRVTAVLEAKNDTETIYRWFADSADNALRQAPGLELVQA